MEEKGLSQTQKTFLSRVSPETAAAMEAESKTWLIRCPICGFEQSVWDRGGIRYKASGNSRQLGKCPNCGRITWNTVYKSPTGVVNTNVLPASQVTGGTTSWAVAIARLALIIAIPVVIIIVGVFLLVTTLNQPVVNTGDAFMTALKSGDYAQAYNLCSPDLQTQLTSVDALSQQFSGFQPAQWSWNSRSVNNNGGFLDGDVTFANGSKGSAHLTLAQVNNAWKISGFNLTPSQ